MERLRKRPPFRGLCSFGMDLSGANGGSLVSTRKRLVVALVLLLNTACPSVLHAALDQCFLRNAILITFGASPGKYKYGTGFFMGDKEHKWLVTNKHMIPSPRPLRSINIRVTSGTGDVAAIRWIEVPVTGKDGKYLSNVRLHPEADVAAIDVSEVINREDLHGSLLPLDLLSTPQRLKDENITLGDEIFLLGYPNFIFDERSVAPILRTGVIATAPVGGLAMNRKLRRSYGLPALADAFLIDANVFPGSSGSVVILKPMATALGCDGSIVPSRIKQRPYVLGIVSGSIPIKDTTGTIQRMGLGIVYSADAIRSVIDQLK